MTGSTGAASPPRGRGLRAASGGSRRVEGVVPGQPDMWAFVLFEALLFTGYFVVYMVCRTRSPELFLASQAQLDLDTAMRKKPGRKPGKKPRKGAAKT